MFFKIEMAFISGPRGLHGNKMFDIEDNFQILDFKEGRTSNFQKIR